MKYRGSVRRSPWR